MFICRSYIFGKLKAISPYVYNGYFTLASVLTTSTWKMSYV